MSRDNLREMSVLASMMLVATVAFQTPTFADETLRYKLVSHSTGFIAMDPGDGVEGHSVGDAKFVGIMMLEDGRLGTVTYIAHYDYVKGTGAFTTFQTTKFDDGSLIRFRNTGDSVLASGKTTFSNCKIEILGGEGKYTGVKGSGSFTGTRLVPFGDGGDSFFEGSFSLTSP